MATDDGLSVADRKTDPVLPQNSQEGVKAVPRLSVLVPAIDSAHSLETTLLSLLQQDDGDVEVVVAHADDYTDPYGLDGDGVCLVNAGAGCEGSDLLNAALECSSGDVVQVLLPGSVVEPGWYSAAAAAFSDRRLAAAAAAVSDGRSSTRPIGFAGATLPRRIVLLAGDNSDHAYPLLCGGYLRRELLEAVGGWLPAVPWPIAEVEMALLLQAIGGEVIRYGEAKVVTDTHRILAAEAGYANGTLLGRLARGYAGCSLSPTKLESLSSQVGRLAAGIFNPASIAHRVGYAFGLQERQWSDRIDRRVSAAAAAWDEHLSQPVQYRRAA